MFLRAQRGPEGPWSRVSSGGRWGGTLVEFACVAPLLFGLVLGLIELSRGFMVSHELTDAARVGCRTGIIPGRSNTEVRSAVDDYLKGLGITTQTLQVLVNDKAGDVSSAASEDEVTVIVTVPVADVTWMPGGRYLTGDSLRGQFTLRRE
jgi:Flp pilus assembly protein TadG